MPHPNSHKRTAVVCTRRCFGFEKKTNAGDHDLVPNVGTRLHVWAPTCLLLAAELLVRDVCGQVGVQHGAEGQAVIPAAAEVGDVNVLTNKFRTLESAVSPERGAAAFISPHVLEIKRGGSGPAWLLNQDGTAFVVICASEDVTCSCPVFKNTQDVLNVAHFLEKTPVATETTTQVS